MEDPKASSNEPAGELFDRWLSHREGASSEPRAPVGPATPDAALQAEQVALAVRLAEEAHEAHVAPVPPTPDAATSTSTATRSVGDDAAPDERLSWSSSSPFSRLAARLRPGPTESTAVAEDSAPPRVTLVASSIPAPRPAPEDTPRPTPPARTTRDTPPSRSVPDNGNVVFEPRTGARRLVGLLLLASLAATAYAGYEAYDVRTTNTVAVAATLGALSLVLWALRAGSSAPRLSVTSGQLEVLGSAGRFVFDLGSPYTPIEVVGTAGRRGWKVLFLRRGMSPFVVDSSMVDPAEFMTVLRRHRPELGD